MDFIKYIDFFNIKFSFYTNNQPNNQTIFGGIMTFLYVSLCILIFFIFSSDDLKRLSPITTISEIPYSERKLVDMNHEKIWIPFRIVDYENEFIDHRKILYIIPYLIEGRANNKKGMDLNYTLLNYKLCNETSLANRPDKYIIDVPLNQLFCIDKDDILFGGNWNHNFLNYLEINLYLCEDGIFYNSSDPRCSKLTNFLKNFNSSLLFDMYFPIVQFQPTNLKTPIQIIYKNYYYRLTAHSYKIEKLYIREHILSDDISLFKSRYKNHSCWGMNTLYSDDYFLPSEFDQISNNSNTSRIYSLNIYMDDGLVHYTRTFKKIIMILSNFFPIFRFLLYFLKRFTQHIKMTITKRNLIELIFENKRNSHKNLFKKKFEQKKKSIVLENKSETEIMKDKTINNNEYNNSNFINNITIIRNNNKYNNNDKNCDIINNKNSYNNKVNMSLNDENNAIKLNKIQSPFIITKSNKSNKSSFFYLLKSEGSHQISKNAYKKVRKSKYIFPFYYYFMDIIFDNLTKPKNFFLVSKTYFTVYNFMCHIYDISSHLVFFKQFNILNNFFTRESEENRISDKIFNKININDNKSLLNIKKNISSKKSLFYDNYFC